MQLCSLIKILTLLLVLTFFTVLSLGCPVFFLENCGHPIYNKSGIIRDCGDNKPMLAGAIEYCVYKRTRGYVKSNHARILMQDSQHQLIRVLPLIVAFFFNVRKINDFILSKAWEIDQTLVMCEGLVAVVQVTTQFFVFCCANLATPFGGTRNFSTTGSM